MEISIQDSFGSAFIHTDSVGIKGVENVLRTDERYIMYDISYLAGVQLSFEDESEIPLGSMYVAFTTENKSIYDLAKTIADALGRKLRMLSEEIYLVPDAEG